jgi:hypothetical protein
MRIQRYTTIMRHAAILRPFNFLPAESRRTSTTDANSSHLLRETIDELSVSVIMSVFGLMACGARVGECGSYRVRRVTAVVRWRRNVLQGYYTSTDEAKTAAALLA